MSPLLVFYNPCSRLLMHRKQLPSINKQSLRLWLVNCCSRKQTALRRRKLQPETGFVCILALDVCLNRVIEVDLC